MTEGPIPRELEDLALLLQEEAAERGLSLRAERVAFGYRFWLPGEGGRGQFSLYYSPKRNQYTLVLPPTPDPDLAPLVELARAKTGARLAGPQVQGEDAGGGTWEEVFGASPLLGQHLASRLNLLHGAGFLLEDFRRLPNGVQLVVRGPRETLRVNAYAGKGGIRVVPACKPSRELSTLCQILGPEGGGRACLPQDEKALTSWVGTDEAGKGDYFGPLVVGAFVADWDVAGTLEDMGLKESKRLSRERVAALSGLLWSRFRPRCSVVEIGPQRYNEIYAQLAGSGGKLNALLGWAHARAIKDLHGREPVGVVVVDKFGSPGHITRYLSGLAGVEVRMRSHAEDNPAVAAASVLAKARFLERLESLSERVGVPLPPGAGPEVVEAGRKLVSLHGEGILAEVAKLHFKTTERILERQEDNSLSPRTPPGAHGGG